MTILLSDPPTAVTQEASTKPASDGAISTQTASTGVPTQSAILHRTPWTPPIAVRAEGIYIDLDNGSKLIDAVGGAAVACLGAGNERVANAIKDQLNKLSYVYNVQLSNPVAEELAHHLVESSSGAFAQCVFVSGGSEALEATIKLARQYYWEIGQKQRKHFIARSLSYHGNTLGALALGLHPARRAPYEVLLPQEADNGAFHHVSPVYSKRWKKKDETEEDYVKRLAQEVEDKFQELGPDNVIGFVAEPVLGATQGCTYAPPGYFKAISEICKRHGALLIYDEVMCGMGRMGSTLHAWQSPNSFTDGVAPDMQAVAKGLGAGYASIGAVLLSKEIANGVRGGSNYLQHGHTYQAHPLACAASLEVQKIIAEENLLIRCEERGRYLGKLLQEELTGPNALAQRWCFDVRGGGLFWGIEFEFTDEENAKWFGPGSSGRFAGRVQARAMELGLIIMGLSGGVDGVRGEHLMLSPAYTITDAEVEEIVRRLVTSVEDVLKATVLSDA